MNITDLALNVWHTNEYIVRSTFDLGGALFNKMAELSGLVPKVQPVQQPTSSGWISLRRVMTVSGVGVGLYLAYRLVKNRKRRPLYVENYEADMVYLFQFPRPLAIPNLSPFALKLETWLRMSDIDYQIVENLPLLHRSSEGTLPYIEINGEAIPDSANVIDVLSVRRDTIDSHLKPEQRSIVRAFEIMLESSLDFCTAKYRFEHFDKFSEIWPINFSFPFMGTLFKWCVERMAKKRIASNPISKHSNDLIEKYANLDLQALSDQLGSKHYLTGFKPTRADAAAFAALCFVYYVPFDNPQRRYVNENCPNLFEFCERIRTRYWPDWAAVTTLHRANTDWKRMIRPSGSRPASRPASTAP